MENELGLVGSATADVLVNGGPAGPVPVVTLTPSGTVYTQAEVIPVHAAFLVDGEIAPDTALLSLNGQPWTGTFSADDQQADAVLEELDEGTYDVQVSVATTLGETGSGGLSLIVDRTLPVVTFDDVSDGAFLTSTSQVFSAHYSDAGTGVADTDVRFYVDLDLAGTGWTTGASGGVATASGELTSGHHTVAFEATDRAGNTFRKTINMFVRPRRGVRRCTSAHGVGSV